MTTSHGQRLSRTCHIDSSVEATACPIKIGSLAREMGFGPRSAAEVEIIASELATNVLRHGHKGTVLAEIVFSPRTGILLTALDEGPGFSDIDNARRDGVSRGRVLSAEVRLQPRDGLGSGLGALERLADSVEIANLEGGGSRVVVFKALRQP